MGALLHGSFEHGRAHCAAFFPWYNTDHHHASLGWHTPHDVHHGHAAARQAQRAVVLAAAYAATPVWFVRHAPTPPALPTAMWINEPQIRPAGLIRPNPPPTDTHHRPRIDDRYSGEDTSTPPSGPSRLVAAVNVTTTEWDPEDDAQ